MTNGPFTRSEPFGTNFQGTSCSCEGGLGTFTYSYTTSSNATGYNAWETRTVETLPDGRKITPCNFCFLKFNSDAFQGRVVTTPNGSVVNDVYWFGNAALTLHCTAMYKLSR